MPTTTTTPRLKGDPGERPGLNEIHLLGRLADVAVERLLPSGDTLVTFRLVVPRPPPPSGSAQRSIAGRRTPTIDTLDCVAWGARERKRVLSYAAGTELEVWGALRRRFYRGPGGLGSRYEVSIDRLSRAVT